MAEAAGLYYEIHGREDAPPLMLSSGLGGSAHYWAPNIAALSERYRVIAYDHRGTGRSDRALPDAVTVDDLAADMLALLDALAIPRATIVGHAAGGVAALALALMAPDRVDKLVVVNGWASPDPHFLRCFAARLALLRGSGPEAYLRAQPLFLYPPNWISANDAPLEAELPEQLAQFPGAATMEKRIAALAAFDVSERLRDIHRPVLVVVSDDDMLVPSNAGVALANGLPIAGFCRAEHGGHAVNVVDPDAFNSFVLAWLAGETVQG
ncbi:pyrimidine utilization protein D [Sphingomonas sp. 10B4]|uniref:pyrimidine utilization protein D n=1 Tax=Sphingomonas sp. 10B4 TaxID=3048575 RepID=UPI002AB512E2|nr:pyrimidine utilization protein D [Sphingomonas sp. 10B4]MDY7522881.1 pyrimidine utilization protein D [Sphingomonas sp. 10B4]MEB0284076.1 pyrimidine utilization protein D [Sphingomonas sp. 10B4]